MESEVKKLVQDTIKSYGTIDILINNAGEIIRPGDWNCNESVWQKTIDVNLKSMWLVTKAVAPSNVMTDMTKSAGEELIEKFKQSTPLKRTAEPEELASAILFLASDEASYITGEVLVVDGGYTLK